jgi:hypothetical protein
VSTARRWAGNRNIYFFLRDLGKASPRSLTLPVLLDVVGEIAAMYKMALSETLVANFASSNQHIYGMTRHAQKLSRFRHSYDGFF